MLSVKTRIHLLFIKLIRYEFWPFYIFYLPAFLYGLFLAIRSKSFTYFTAVNPAMKYGGAFDMSKDKILHSVKQEYKPVSIFVKFPFSIEEVNKIIKNNNLTFPLVLKPNIGERGKLVDKIIDQKELSEYLGTIKGDLIIQEYIDFKYEIGVLYYRYPWESKGNISSVVVRKFLEVEGDGKSTLFQLLMKNQRALFRINYLTNKFKRMLSEVIPLGRRIQLEPIGNHNRGTTFLNGKYMIDRRLVKVFKEISDNINGFYYGRFDVKFESFDDLYEGKNLKILEINGVNSEPAHIYDPSYKLVKAYKDVFQHMKIIYSIARWNHAHGIKYSSKSKFLKDLINHVRQN